MVKVLILRNTALLLPAYCQQSPHSREESIFAELADITGSRHGLLNLPKGLSGASWHEDAFSVRSLTGDHTLLLDEDFQSVEKAFPE